LIEQAQDAFRALFEGHVAGVYTDIGRPAAVPLSMLLKLFKQRLVALLVRLQEEEHKLSSPTGKLWVAQQDIEGDDWGAWSTVLVDAWTSKAVQENDALSSTAAQDRKPGTKIMPQQLMLRLSVRFKRPDGLPRCHTIPYSQLHTV
jgi:hypothetical protein